MVRYCLTRISEICTCDPRMYSVPDFRVNSSIDDVGRDEVTNDQSYRGAPPILCEPEFHGSGKSNLLEGNIFIFGFKRDNC